MAGSNYINRLKNQHLLMIEYIDMKNVFQCWKVKREINIVFRQED